MTIHILIADDQALLRATFRMLIEANPDMEVVGEATDGNEAVELTRTHHPTVVLMDIRMPRANGLTATTSICADPDLSATRVLIVTNFETDEYVANALRPGASGFLGKDVSADALLDGIRTVAAGECSCPHRDARTDHAVPRDRRTGHAVRLSRAAGSPHRAGTRGHDPGRREQIQHRDRPPTRGQPADGPHTCPAGHDEAARARPDLTGGHRVPDRSGTAETAVLALTKLSAATGRHQVNHVPVPWPTSTRELIHGVSPGSGCDNVLSVVVARRRQPILSRVRVALGLAGIAAGTAWAVGGVDAIGSGALAALRAVPVLVVMVGVLNLLRRAVPRGGLAGPLALVGAGSVAVAVQLDALRVSQIHVAGQALLIFGGVVVAMSRRSREDPLAAIVSRCWSVFLPTGRTVHDVAPHKFIVRCLFGDLRLDLSRADFPGEAHRVTVDVTICAGWVEIRVPHNWTVRAGRLQLARRTQFSGELSHPVPVLDVPQRGDEPMLVVLNVQGWYGRLEVRRDQPPAAPSGSGLDRSEVT